MGFRFRKSVKIAPGVRMNIGKRGVGFSAGVKGARISTGPSGTRLTTSIPGTGISYQTKLSSKKRRPARKQYNTLTEQQKVKNNLELIEQNKLSVAVFENKLDLLRSIHKEYTEPIDWVSLSDVDHEKKRLGSNEMQAAQNLKNFRPTWRDRLFGRIEYRKQELYSQIEEARALDEEMHKQFEKQSELACHILSGEHSAYEEVLEKELPFDDILELGAQINYQIESSDTIVFDVDIKAKDVVPTKNLSLTKTGKLSERNMTRTQYFDIYQDYACSIALRLGRDAFNLLPIQSVYVHINDLVEQGEFGTVISVRFDRRQFELIKFEVCDCSDTIELFEHHMDFKKTKGLKLINKL